MKPSATPQEFNIHEYLRILARRRWMIFTCLLVATLAAAAGSYLTTPVYRSVCTISIERTGARIMRQELSSSESSWLDYSNFYNTQYKILESDRVLKLAAEKLDMETRENRKTENNGVIPSLAQFKAEIAKTILHPDPAGETMAAAREHIKTLRAGLRITPIRDSHLVEIAFVAPDRMFAAEAANAIAQAYIDFTLSAKLDLARASGNFFVNRISQLKEEIEKSEEALQDYMRRHGIVTGDANEVALQNLGDLRNRFMEARTDAASKRARWEVLAKSSPSSLDEVRHNGLIENLARDLAEMERSYREKMTTFGNDYPEVRQLKAKLDSASEKLQSETARLAAQTVESARTDFLQAQRRSDELGRLFSEAENRVGKLQSDFVDYMALKAEVDRKRVTFQELLEKQSQVDLSAGFQDAAHNVRIIDEGIPAEFVYKPKKATNILLGLLFGLFLGLGSALLMEFIDNTLKTPEDIRQYLALPVLGMIPARDAERRRSWLDRVRREKTVPENQSSMVTTSIPLSPIAEAYRELRTAVLLTRPEKPPRHLMVTSCLPGEGKTTTTINLAIALAQLGRKILIVDTDLRRPRCHHVLRVTGARGVSSYLAGMEKIDALIHSTAIEGIHLFPAGPIPPNPAELLDSERFHRMVRELEETDFDHILFDSPPVVSVVDAVLIGRHTTGTIVVVRASFTSRDSARLGVEKLNSGQIHLSGAVLNAVQNDQIPYQYRQHRYGYTTHSDPPAETGGKVVKARPSTEPRKKPRGNQATG